MQTASQFTGPGTEPILHRSVKFIFFVTFGICLVIPHSAQVVTAGLLIVTWLALLTLTRIESKLSYIGVCYILGVIVTCIYMVVGLINGAPDEAAYQTLAIYIAAPLLWIVIWRTILRIVPMRTLIHYITIYTWLACASVAVFFYLFLNYGVSSVTFFSSSANVNLTEGYSAATMHVYGSLIFLTAAFFGAPEVISNKIIRITLLAALTVAALTSGRSALLLAMPVGLLVGFFVQEPRNNSSGLTGGLWLRYLLFSLVAIGGVLLLDRFTDAVDLSVILDSLVRKLAEGGGLERTDQNSSLWYGILEYYGVGAGHGIGTTLLRSEEFAWRYENVPLAVLFKVGVIGSAIYAAPFAITLWRYWRLAIARKLETHDRFVFAGFIAILAAAPTNPYLESFIFQWMYIFPMIYIDMRHFQTPAHRPPLLLVKRSASTQYVAA